MLILAGGRCSRLYRELIDNGKQCSSVMADLSETVDAGALIFALEVISGIDPRIVEDRFWSVLQASVQAEFTDAEVIRAKRIFLADWVYGFERVENRAVALAQAILLFDPGYLEKQREGVLATSAEDVLRVARKYLRPSESGVVGWSLPKTDGIPASLQGVE
jgi:predicted Zn-dependent peptidase